MQTIKIIKTPGMLTLAAFLLVSGINSFLGIGVLGMVAAILAIVAGALLLVGK